MTGGQRGDRIMWVGKAIPAARRNGCQDNQETVTTKVQQGNQKTQGHKRDNMVSIRIMRMVRVIILTGWVVVRVIIICVIG